MRQERKASLTTVSKIRRYHSSDNRYKRSIIEKRRPNTVIHISLGLTRDISSIDNHPYTRKTEKSSAISNSQENENRSIHSVTVSKVHRGHYSPSQKSDNVIKRFSSTLQNCTNTSHDQHSIIQGSLKATNLSLKSGKVTPSKDIINDNIKKNKNDFSDKNGITNDYHRKVKKNKKPKCSRRCIIISLLAIILTILLITSILIVLLIKPKSKQIIPINSPVLRWNSTGITVAGIVGSSGKNNNQLNTPVDVIVDYANNIYIADYMNYRIQKYDFGASIGTTVAGNGTVGKSPYQFDKALRVIIDSNDNLYVADSNNHRIQYFSKGSTYGRTIAGTSNSPGNSSTQFNIPYGIALHPISSTLYVADYYNHRIVSYASGINYSNLVFGGNGGGTSNTQLFRPIGLHYDLFSNSLIISNFAANNVVRYVFGDSSWTLLAGNANGTGGISSTDLSGPMEAIYDPMGNIYVADRNNHRIQFYDGQLIGKTIAGISNVNGSNATTLDWPRSLRLDNQLNLYVADSNNHRIQKFERY